MGQCPSAQGNTKGRKLSRVVAKSMVEMSMQQILLTGTSESKFHKMKGILRRPALACSFGFTLRVRRISLLSDDRVEETVADGDGVVVAVEASMVLS